MKQIVSLFIFTTALWAVAAFLPAFGIGTADLPKNINYSYSVSMDHPNRHYIQVELRCENQKSDFIDFKMPVWTPGYYGIQNNSKHLVGFKAVDQQGNILPFKKTLKNTWRVTSKNKKTVLISYEVYADELSVVNSYLDAEQAVISPTSVYLFPDGKISEPVLVNFKLNGNWSKISTGLDRVEDRSSTFFASNFDVLFDCPTLLGNQQEISFSVKGIPHTVAVSEKDTLDKTRFISDLKNIVEAATTLIGHIPYRHYTFLTIGSIGGGMEHHNSCLLSCRTSVADTSDINQYKGWLSFVAHEYFHLYNVKSIRPIALGPFDYDRECYTNLLWFSEGVTVYYENILLNRAGLFSRKDCFKCLTESITGFENRPGHLFESATESSFDAWIHFFERNAENRNNTISYYDKGCALGLLLDLKIRQATHNRQSLDDVMRALYNTYFLEHKRGFTDNELRSTCEKVAGISLNEIFTSVSKVDPIDYPGYLSYAGLTIDTTAHVVTNSVYFGAGIRSVDDRFRINRVERNSPAWQADLGNNIEVISVDGKTTGLENISGLLKDKKPGDTLTLVISVGSKQTEVPVTLAPVLEKSFLIEESDQPSPIQKEIRESWLKL